MRVSFQPLLILAASLSMTGCAVNGDPRDPLEPTNRVIHSFNEAIDNAAMKPLAKGYQAVTPVPVQGAVRNFYSNLDDVTVLANNLLQLKLEQASTDLMRIAVNSTLGFFGLLDVAGEMGLKKHNEDFGQTLGHWGVASGAYLVLPFLGPSSFRDGVGVAVDSMSTDLVYFNKHTPSRIETAVLRMANRRADFLDAKTAIDEAALDVYEFTRDFYLERREALVQDGRVQPLE